MACQRSMTHSERERKDGVPKKHDPRKKEKEKRWRAKEARPQKKMEREAIKNGAVSIIHIVHWPD